MSDRDLAGLIKHPRRRTTPFVDKFKAFVRRGNVIDLAVGVIIGGAFGRIVSSLVGDLLMPPLGLLLARIDFRRLKWTLKPAHGSEDAVTVDYGEFLSNVLDFSLVSLVVFAAIEGIHRVHRSPTLPAPDAVECPFCASSIPKKAVRCPHCTSGLSRSGRGPSDGRPEMS